MHIKQQQTYINIQLHESRQAKPINNYNVRIVPHFLSKTIHHNNQMRWHKTIPV